MMGGAVRVVGENRAVELFGVRLVGVNAENGIKLLVSVAFVLAIWLVSRLLRTLLTRIAGAEADAKYAFWTRQGVRIIAAGLTIFGLASIWFDDPNRMSTALGLLSAGLAFALQKVVTAVAGYFVILRGKVFNVGDRIVMGGVRGDVIALDFTQTTIMEMGQPPPVQSAEPAMWVQSRQYTGRIVRVSNAKIFDEPVYNYTRDFPYIWEELVLPVPYSADRRRAESILLESAQHQTVQVSQLSEENLREMQRRYVMRPADLHPSVYYRLTDNWLEMTVRFIALDHDVRALKDRMSREILDALDEAHIPIASSTFEVTALPPLQIQNAPRQLSADNSRT
ncbi:MAG: mechanosensitive ion channel family protein [Gemmataceae bacterium]